MPRKTSSPRRKSPKTSQYESELKRDIAAEGRKIGELASKVYTKNSTQGIPFAGSKTAAALAQAFEEPVAYSATDLQEELENDTGDCINKLSMYAVEPDLFNLGRPGEYQTDKVKNGDALHLDERAAVMGSVGASQVLCDILHGVRSKTITLQDGLDKKLIYVEDLIEHIHDRYGSVITLEKDTTSVLDRVSRDQRVNLERHLLKQLFNNVVAKETNITTTGAGTTATGANDFFVDKFKNMVIVKEKSVGKTWKTADRTTAEIFKMYHNLRRAVKDFLKGSPRVMFGSNLRIKCDARTRFTATADIDSYNAGIGEVTDTTTGIVYDVYEGYTGTAAKIQVEASIDISYKGNVYILDIVSHILTIVAAHVLTYANTAAIDFLVQLGQKASQDSKVNFSKALSDELESFKADVDAATTAGAATNRTRYPAGGGFADLTPASGYHKGPAEASLLLARKTVFDETSAARGRGVAGLADDHLAGDTQDAVLTYARALPVPAGSSRHAMDLAIEQISTGVAAGDAAAAIEKLGNVNWDVDEAQLKAEASHLAALQFIVPHTVFAPGLLAALELYKVPESRFDDEMALQLNTNKEVRALFKAAHESYDMHDESSGAKSYVRATDTTPAWLMSAEDKLKYEQQFEKIKEYSGRNVVDTAKVTAVATSNSAANLATAFTNYRDTQGVAKRLHAITGFGRRRKRSSKRKASFGRRKRHSKSKKASFGRRKHSSKSKKTRKASFGRKKKASHRRR